MNSKANKGAQVSAYRNRMKSLMSYYENPRICEECSKIIEVGENQKPCRVKVKRFCNRSCAVTFNNRGIRRHGSPLKDKCPDCGRLKSRRSKMCQNCRIENRLISKVHPDLVKPSTLMGNRTKFQLFQIRVNWQSARSSIQRHARRVLNNSDKEKKCLECGYDKHVDCCHIKPVSDFGDDVLIKEINHIDNLMWLCPNHHWEFDNKIIK